MINLTLFDIVWIAAICVILALCVLWCLELLWRRATPRPSGTGEDRLRNHFLFNGDRLIDCDCRITAIPDVNGAEIENWSDLRDWFGGRFGTLPSSLHDTAQDEPRIFAAASADDRSTLTISARKGAKRVTFYDPCVQNAADRHHTQRMAQVLCPMLEHVPCAIAVINTDGTVGWRNQLFTNFFEAHIPRLLQTLRSSETKNRICLPGVGDKPDRHVELTCLHLDGARVLYIADISEVARAEKVRQEFIQTLTKTFANLTTGLAVFDRHRRLALFNPALLDLTGLPAVFLSGQPPLALFFDRLRDCKMLPEPRNYGDWREQINDMIDSAADGRYEEDWYLASGLTYRVTGRPHPDGAIAFLFEDISDEVAMTRQIRTQLDVRQAALDTLDRAIAVIGADHAIVLCNQPCSDLLGIDPDGSFANMSLDDFMSACRSQLSQDPFWETVERAVLDRHELEHVFQAPNGGLYQCQVAPIPGKKMKISIMPQKMHLPKPITQSPLPA